MDEKCKIFKLQKPGQEAKKLLLDFYNSAFVSSKWSEKNLNLFFTEKDPGACFIIEKDSVIKGFVLGKIKKLDHSIMDLSALFVANELRGLGLAKKLVRLFLVDVVENSSVEKVKLHFRETNNLQKFYAGLGFRNEYIDGTYKNGEPKHCMEMVRNDIMKLYL